MISNILFCPAWPAWFLAHRDSRHGVVQTTKPLLCPERVDGIQAGGATRWDGCSDQSAQDETKGRQSDRPGIGCGDTIEECMQHAVAPESDADTGRGSESHEQQGLAHDHADDGSAIGAQGHANADLPGSLSDHVGEQAVKTDEGDEKREPAENAYDSGSQFLRTNGVFHGFRHGGELPDGEMGIDLSDLATQLGNHRAGRNFSADGNLHVFANDRQVERIVARYLRYAEIELGAAGVGEGVLVDVVDDSDHRCSDGLSPKSKLLADRVPPTEVSIHKDAINDCYRNAGGGVARVEETAATHADAEHVHQSR